jgi:hypothetical protein
MDGVNRVEESREAGTPPAAKIENFTHDRIAVEAYALSTLR